MSVGALLFYNRFFFFNDTATTEIYTLSLHDALPICDDVTRTTCVPAVGASVHFTDDLPSLSVVVRSEEHTSELQSRPHLVCRLLLEKKKKKKRNIFDIVIKKKKKIQ